jgi:hypothetical protein
MSYFIRNANVFTIASEEALDIQKVLPVGNYTVKSNPITGQYFLEMVDSFEPLKKLYGTTTKNTDRILRTFMDRPNSTGVMLSGEKGSGKSLLAKTISIEAAKMGVPTLIINTAYSGDSFNKFMQDIEQPCVILFDEFEKVYGDNDQEAALTLMDGVFPSRKLFVLTCNDKWRINQHMRNRPGRIFYMIEFSGLDAAFIREYCNDVLVNKQHTDKVCEIACLFEEFNFDMLKALIEEMNRYDETPQQAISMLNAKPEYNNKGNFDVKLFIAGHEITTPELATTTWHGNPLMATIFVEYDTDPECKLETDEDTYHQKIFVSNDLKKVAAEQGIFTFQNEAGDVMMLTRQKIKESFNYMAL